MSRKDEIRERWARGTRGLWLAYRRDIAWLLARVERLEGLVGRLSDYGPGDPMMAVDVEALRAALEDG